MAGGGGGEWGGKEGGERVFQKATFYLFINWVCLKAF